MIVKANEAYGIRGITENYIVSDTGAITFCYMLKNPECYSLIPSELEERHNDLFRAFKSMPHNTIVHKQDVFLRNKFDGNRIKGNSLIQRAEKAYFDGKTYLEHYCLLSFSLAGLASLNESYIKNPLSYKEHLTRSDRERITGFLESIEGAINVIKHMPETTVTPLSKHEIEYFIFNYTNGLYFDNVIRNPHCGDSCLSLDEKKGAYFVIAHESHLPDTDLPLAVKDESLPNPTGSLFSSMFELLGVHFKYTHVVNQFWHFRTDYKEKLKKQIKDYYKNRDWDKDIQYTSEKLIGYDRELKDEHNILCKHSYNVFILEYPEYFEKSCEYVKEVLKNNDFYCEKPSRELLYNIHRGSVIGAENKLSDNYFYLTDLHSTLCLTLQYSVFQEDDKGTLFNERLYNTPHRIDFWDEERKRIHARNIIIVASTGEGKTVISENIVQQDIEENIIDIVVEFGKSFYQLTLLYPEISLHIDYDSSKPLGINPFKLYGELTPEKIINLTNIVLRFMRSKEIQEDATQVISLRLIIKDYYKHIKDNHSFINFYFYIKDNSEDIFSRLELDNEKFNISTFLHNCKEFLEGGIYENVCKESELTNNIHESQFIVFELTRIKNDPFLVSVIMSILTDTIETKLYDKSKKGRLIFDEYAETAQIKDVFNDQGVHSTVAFCYQKFRKENSSVMTIIQAPSQLPKNEFTDNIIANTQILIVMPTTEKVYKDIQKTFEIGSEKQMNLMRSIRSDLKGSVKYSEFFTRFMDAYAIALRLELSPTKFLAFQTDAETTLELQKLTEETGSLEKAITKKLQS